MIRKKVIAIVGPTASGKTAIAIKLAKKFNGEIISADSRQVFRKLDIGTAKDLSEYGEVRYHLIDIKNPGGKLTLFDYLPIARGAIDDILSRGKLPIIVGGTGLYVQALLEGFKINISGNKETEILTREELSKKSVSELQEILQELNPEAFINLADQKNARRLIRAIEKSQAGEKVSKVKPEFASLQIGLLWPREELNNRIDKRVEERFDQGMLEEVINLLKAGVSTDWLLSLGLEYRIITEFLMKNCKKGFDCNAEELKATPEFLEMKENLKIKSHQYAKRQMTWFKRFPEILWIDKPKDAENVVLEFFTKHN